ncbi:hypothetical protein RYX36_022019, partial [Vicia faba]
NINTDRKLMFLKEFDASYVGFMEDGAKWLVENTDIKRVGVDYLSVGPFVHKFQLNPLPSLFDQSLIKLPFAMSASISQGASNTVISSFRSSSPCRLSSIFGTFDFHFLFSLRLLCVESVCNINIDRKLMFKKEFDASYVGFMEDGAKWLVENTNIKIVGVNYLSVAAFVHSVQSHLAFFWKARKSFLWKALR